MHPVAVRAQRHATAQYIARYVEQTFDLKNHKATSGKEGTDGKEEKRKETTKDTDATAVAMLEDLMEIEGNNQLRDAINSLRQKETGEVGGDGSAAVPFIEATVEFTMRPKKKKWKTVKTTVGTGSTAKTATKGMEKKRAHHSNGGGGSRSLPRVLPEESAPVGRPWKP